MMKNTHRTVSVRTFAALRSTVFIALVFFFCGIINGYGDDRISTSLSPAGGNNDVKIPVHSASASEFQYHSQNIYGIERTFDGDRSTYYYSRFSGAGTTFPVILTYNFSDVSRMDYLRYYRHTNGYLQDTEIWVADNGADDLRKHGDFNFDYIDALIVFDPPLINPTKVEFRVKSGRNNYVACVEMEFYRKDIPDFNYLSIFTDHSCSQLLPGVTRNTIDGISDPFFKDLALRIFSNAYDSGGFRSREYRAYIHPDVFARENKTAPYSMRDNPTGIFVKKDQELIVFASGLGGQMVSIITQDLTTGRYGTQRTYPLFAGMNRIKAEADGLIYVQYYSPLGKDAPKVKINFVTGSLNGYFDIERHSRDEWQAFLNNAVAPDFDLVGRFAHLTFSVEAFKNFTPDGLALIERFDEMIRLQHEIMGLYKYNRLPDNRVYAHLDHLPFPETSYMYASNYRTAFSWSAIFDPRYASGNFLELHRFNSTAIWGPTHEIGHLNQIRPGLRWDGMAEVTVNIYSMYVQTSFGIRSKLHTDGIYTMAFNDLLGKDKPHRVPVTTGDRGLFVQLVPFWQLKLYLVDVLGKTDFYKDLFYHYMAEYPDPPGETDGRWQLYFVKTASRIAGLNLTNFFEQWGFLTPVDTGTGRFAVTQAQINTLKAEINAMNLPQPPKDFTTITDETVNNFR